MAANAKESEEKTRAIKEVSADAKFTLTAFSVCVCRGE